MKCFYWNVWTIPPRIYTYNFLYLINYQNAPCSLQVFIRPTKEGVIWQRFQTLMNMSTHVEQRR